MKFNIKYLYLALIFLIFQACQPNVRFAGKNNVNISDKSKYTNKTDEKKSKDDDNSKIDYSKLTNPTKALISEAESWLGVPYKFGGDTKNGVDCSAFVQNVFQSQGYKVPRTSSQQYDSTERIDFTEKKAGDLIFFKNKNTVNHVGIYVGNGYMIHSSTSSGVIKQSIFESYFLEKLAGVGRVKNYLTKNE